MTKPTLAFIDHSFHQKTRSSDFLRELFKQHFEVHEYWDESWQGGPTVSPKEINKHSYVFFLQTLNPPNELKNIKIPMLWAPMYDGVRFHYWRWKLLSAFNIKILSFSRKITSWSNKFNISTFETQYYYLPPHKTPEKKGNHVLFWYRGGIDFNHIRKILDPDQINSFLILENTDTENSPPLYISDEEKERYHVTHVREGFVSKEKYLNLLKQCTIFIAPRKKEGIGAFTEALAMGKSVIAYDDAVHNEYITDGVDGFLFNEHTKKIDLSLRERISVQALKRSVATYKKWESDKEKIIPFMFEKRTILATRIPLFFLEVFDTLERKILLLYYKIKRFLPI